MSIFEPLCAKSSIFRNFWIELQSLSRKQSEKRVILRKPLIVALDSSTRTTVMMNLIDDSVFYVSGQGKIFLAYVKWSLLRSFTEEDENGDVRFGFSLKTSAGTQDFFTENEDDLNIWVNHLSYILIMSDFDNYFVILKNIDSGQFGSVDLCQDLETNSNFAVKKVSKLLLSRPKALNLLYNEINIQRKLDHPSIVKLFKVFEDNENIYLVMEYIKEGNLFRRISQTSNFSERDVMIFCRDLFQVIDYIHSFGIIHRDLKPENILLLSKDSLYPFKIADFGLSCYIKDFERTCSGSPGYIAPEMLRGAPYNSKADIFSAGVISFILLTGFAPFGANTTKETISKNLKCQVHFNASSMRCVNSSAKIFLKKVLNPDPELRFNAQEVLQVEWFKVRKYSETDTVSTSLKVDGSKEFQGFGKAADRYYREN
jgi:calcium-dependent protein kinase